MNSSFCEVQWLENKYFPPEFHGEVTSALSPPGELTGASPPHPHPSSSQSGTKNGAMARLSPGCPHHCHPLAPAPSWVSALAAQFLPSRCVPPGQVGWIWGRGPGGALGATRVPLSAGRSFPRSGQKLELPQEFLKNE